MYKLQTIETTNHLLLHCTIAQLHTTFGRQEQLNNFARKNWDCECMATYWNIWKERNRRIFQLKEMPLQEIKGLVQGDIAKWRDNG
jgi:hypothetical protein